MANKHSANVTISLDNAAGTLTAITNYINSWSLGGSQGVYADDGLGVTNPNHYPAKHIKTVSLNGRVNTTTEGIFGPLVYARTSVSKTFQYYDGVKYLNGEVYPTSTQYSGSEDSMLAFSFEATVDGTMNRTSVAL